MRQIIIRPSVLEYINAACFTISGSLLVYAGYLSSLSIKHKILEPGNVEIKQEFEMGIGLFFIVLGLVVLVGGVDFSIRKVIIDDHTVSSTSPLRLYTQLYRIEDISMARLTPLAIRSNVLELLINKKWIVFVSNQKFKATAFDYFQNANEEAEISIPQK